MKIINEKDWKLFIEKLPNWQEKYMERLVVDEYIKLLYSGNSISDTYLGIKDSLKSESPDIFTKDIKRARFYDILTEMITNKMIAISDLDDFTEETIQEVNRYVSGAETAEDDYIALISA